jgi:hypothetical protein
MMKMGSWWIRSKSDPRWNTDGRCIVGGFCMPQECEDTIDKLKKVLGEPPEDLTCNYMKD